MIPGLGRSLKEGMAIYPSTLAWRIPMDRGAWWATIHRGHTESDMTEVTKQQQQYKDGLASWSFSNLKFSVINRRGILERGDIRIPVTDLC